MPGQNNAMQAIAITLRDDTSLNKGMLIGYDRRDGKKIDIFPTMLNDLAQAENGQSSGKILESDPAGKTRRQQLAEWVVMHDSFSKAYVNRIWGHFFGRGLNKDAPVDDFGAHNELIHPDLLAYLGDEFKNANYDPRKLLEWIACSDAYSLSHVAVKEYAATKYDPYFARMPLKAMSPEVLFDSLMTATRAEFKEKGDRKELRDAWMRKLVRNFGDDEGNELTFNGTVVQALLMMNGSELNGEIGVGNTTRNGKPNLENVIVEVVKRNSAGGNVNTDKVFDDLFLLTLNRRATGAEKALLRDVQRGNAKVDLGAPEAPKSGVKPKPAGGVVIPPSSPNDITFYQDVFWALLNTNEFMLNH